MSELDGGCVPGWIADRDIEFLRGFLPENKGGTVVEVGIALGRSTAGIGVDLMKRYCRHVCVDTFDGGLDPTDVINQLYRAGRGRFFRLGFEYNMRALGIWNSVELLECTSLKAAEDFEPESVDLCFLDADHREVAVRADIDAWWPKIKPGGVLMGDDYQGPGVRPAVDEFVRKCHQTSVFGFRCWAVRKDKET